MEKLKFKPYALFIISQDEQTRNYRYGIMRYNDVKSDWEFLSDIFTDKQTALDKIEILNKDAGDITTIIEL